MNDCCYGFELKTAVFQDGSFNCDSKEIAENAMDWHWNDFTCSKDSKNIAEQYRPILFFIVKM